MEKEQLKQHLFTKVARVFAVLDGASIPELRSKIYELSPVNHCLMSGDLEPDMQEVAPYLVRLYPDDPFTDWLLSECWGNNWGIFVQTRGTVLEMKNHFRTLLTAYDEAGMPLLFRYYDPRVLTKFLPTCDAEQIIDFFGKVDCYFAESDDQEKLVCYELNENEFKETLF